MNPLPSKRDQILASVASLTNRSADERGTLEFAKAIAAQPEITADQMLASLLPTVESELREAAYQEKKAEGRISSLDFTIGVALEFHFKHIHLCDSATLAGELARSSFLRERLFAFATSKGFDVLRDTRKVVEAWHRADRVIAPTCCECNSVMVERPGERADPDCGLGAIDAGLMCSNCERDERTHHAPTSRGSDGSFLG